MEYHAVVVTALRQLCKVLAGLPVGNATRVSDVPEIEERRTYLRSMVPIKL
jgi:hypothetical protein